MYYKIFHNLTTWAPCDYSNIVILAYNLHSVSYEFNIRKPLCRTNIPANAFLTVVSLYGTFCLILSLNQNLLHALCKHTLMTIFFIHIVKLCLLVLLSNYYAVYIFVIINTGVTLKVLYTVINIESASFTSSLFITASTEFIFNV